MADVTHTFHESVRDGSHMPNAISNCMASQSQTRAFSFSNLLSRRSRTLEDSIDSRDRRSELVRLCAQHDGGFPKDTLYGDTQMASPCSRTLRTIHLQAGPLFCKTCSGSSRPLEGGGGTMVCSFVLWRRCSTCLTSPNASSPTE